MVKTGANPAGVPDILGVSLFSHDYVNHRWGPKPHVNMIIYKDSIACWPSSSAILGKKVGLDNSLVSC